jgi:8-oxo-dGTP pyrophosphatase MutT (NUDIX family)/glyoxylase-like metal-dependent hydrolase (beta-lactamase superfamily II)
MSEFFLRFLGVGNAHAPGLGSSAAVLELGTEPWLLIDCGPDSLPAYVETYGGLPTAIFITHAHFDHIGGLEALFYRLATAASPVEPPRLLVPVELVAVLQRRLADYPNLLAEGGCNFWDVFHLIPVAERFWHRDLRFTVFPVRHHDYLAAFGLALEGRFLFTGDTRPIPEILNRYASRGEAIFHDCGTRSNPSHTGYQDLTREYKPEQRGRLVLYHYGSEADGQMLEGRGYRVARRGERLALSHPRPEPLACSPEPRETRDILLHPDPGTTAMPATPPTLFRGRIISLTQEWVRLPNGHETELEIIHHPGGAAVVALDQANQVCLLRQYRYATGGWLWELPAGKIDDGEPPAQTARRELEEEAGREAADWRELGFMHSSPGIFTEVVYLYLARHLTPVALGHEQEEVIEVHWLPLNQALEWCRDGTISDAKTLIGLFRAQALLAGASENCDPSMD